eukprot:g9869.t1
MKKEELQRKVFEYYKAVEKGNVNEIMNLYSPSKFSTKATVIDPVGTPPRIGLASIRELYDSVIKPPLKVKIVPINMFFAPSVNTVSTQMVSSRWNSITGERKILHANQEFQFGSDGKIINMKAVWTLDALDKKPLKTCIVTGGASGIGKATCHRFSNDGFQVIIADVNDKEGTKLAEEIHGKYMHVDVSDSKSVKQLIDTTLEIFGHLNVFVANAGILGMLGRTGDYPEDAFNRVIKVNLNGIFHCLKYACKAMAKQKPKGGSIIATSSTTALRGFPLHPAYTMAKGGIVSLVRALAVEYGPSNIRVNSIAPGTTKTNLSDESGMFNLSRMDPEMEKSISKMLPLPGMVTAKGVAATVRWLGSDDAKDITGHVIPVDRGYVAAGYQVALL